MASSRKKKLPPGHPSLQRRVSVLERRVDELASNVGALNAETKTIHEELTLVRDLIRQLEKRTIRGESIMLELQGDMRRANFTLDRIAAAMNLPKPPQLPEGGS